MFRNHSHWTRVGQLARASSKEAREVKAAKIAYKKEMLKRWKMKFFSPKVTEETIPNRWFDSSRIKALNKAYEQMRNTNRLSVKFDQKDLEEYAKFNVESYQYYQVPLLVQTVHGAVLRDLPSESTAQADRQ